MSGFGFTAASFANSYNQNNGAYNNGTTSQNAWNWNNMPDLLGSLTGGAADIISSMNGNPDNVTYINGNPQAPQQEKTNYLPWVLMGSLGLFILGAIVFLKLRKKK